MKYKLRCEKCGRFMARARCISSNYCEDCVGRKSTLSLPLVTFWYPSSANGVAKKRCLRVTKAAGEYVEGFELTNSWAKKGKFKRFKAAKFRSLPILAEFLPNSD